MSKRKTGSAKEVPTITVAASRCRACGSTDRDQYFATRVLAIDGMTSDGELYTHVVWRRTRCQGCGQYRIDKSFENRTADCSGSEQVALKRAA